VDQDQQLRLGRIVLEDTQASHQQVVIDLVFQGNNVKGGIEHFGVWRDRNEGSICPFVLNEDGQVDFGTGYGGEDRVYEFEILTAPIGLGNQIGWRSEQYETQMKVVSVTQLV
jgi:hypothetical protein